MDLVSPNFLVCPRLVGMAKVGFNPLAFGTEDTRVATGSGEREGATTGAGNGLAEGCVGATGAGSSIRLFFLHLPLKG